jgi:hypothetical protein
MSSCPVQSSVLTVDGLGSPIPSLLSFPSFLSSRHSHRNHRTNPLPLIAPIRSLPSSDWLVHASQHAAVHPFRATPQERLLVTMTSCTNSGFLTEPP